MISINKQRPGDAASEITKKALSGTTQGAASVRRTLQVLQPSVINENHGRGREPGKAPPKRKLWGAKQVKGSKRVKAEVAVKDQNAENDAVAEGTAKGSYELMVKETPPSTYWKEVAEERRKALSNVLLENERLHKDIEAKEVQISKLRSENEELQELVQHVQHMADMIERLTGKSPQSLDDLQELAFDGEDEDAAESEDDDDAESDDDAAANSEAEDESSVCSEEDPEEK
ncbi:geminin [Paramormyrops kingsleyae]|uniref:Geminin DNA replication inhibitor n=1 Tax=Paramormyrops kingsleyae TaxID=1676925 RepID=A0A3B3RVQ3_9TELE|nr:geminin [Paramormyrops kingsleyae]XP_023675884.1 geminin [Paramormyrops kingsleyae]